VPWQAAFIHRTGVQLAAQSTAAPAIPGDARILKSDTQQLSWDTIDKVVTVNTARSKAVIGFASGGATIWTA
jgi:hypothetical protein